MPAGNRLGAEEQDLICSMFEEGYSKSSIADRIGRSHSVVVRTLQKFHPTTKLATRLIKASSIKLAERIIKHATVEEAIDVLSRPNVRVLDPIIKEVDKGPAFMISVDHMSLGGVVSNQPKLGEGAIDVQGTAIRESTGSGEGQPASVDSQTSESVPQAASRDQESGPSRTRHGRRSPRGADVGAQGKKRAGRADVGESTKVVQFDKFDKPPKESK